jgi:hypothetical protein
VVDHGLGMGATLVVNTGKFILGWLDSNQRMAESKSAALPLGYTPPFFASRKSRRPVAPVVSRLRAATPFSPPGGRRPSILLLD